jgi:hypothetical protein
MDMKYFQEKRVENGTGDVGIVLEEHVFSIVKDEDKFAFREECDGYFVERFTKEQALELLREATAWIERA